jgi:hypothetical protein
VYLWRHQLELEGKDCLEELLKLMAVKQREEDSSFDSAPVGLINHDITYFASDSAKRQISETP